MTMVVVCVCDICGRRTPRVEQFSTATSNGIAVWDVGECCLYTPFKIHRHRHVDVAVTVKA
jgi:hypothetical protein